MSNDEPTVRDQLLAARDDVQRQINRLRTPSYNMPWTVNDNDGLLARLNETLSEIEEALEREAN